MSGLHWQEWFDDSVVRLTAVKKPYLLQSISLLSASRIITTRICLADSADENDLKFLYNLISEALKAADHSGVGTKRTDTVDQIFHEADETIETLCRKYGILGLDRENNVGIEERNLTTPDRAGFPHLAALSRSKGTTVFLMTFWPANMNNSQHARYTLEYVVEKGLTLRHVLLLTYQKSLKGKSRIPSFSLNQNPGFFTIIPEIVKDFNLPGRHASKCQLHLHQQNTICQLDLQREFSDSCHGLHLLLDRKISESEITEFPTEHRKEIVETYRNIWRLDEKDAYFCAREISGCLVLLDPKKFKGRQKRIEVDDGDTFSVQSFSLGRRGLMPETIVTVGASPDRELSSTPAHLSIPATSSILSSVIHDVSDICQCPQQMSDTPTITGRFSFDTARETFESFPLSLDSAPPSPGVFDMKSDETPESSCETFKTAQEAPMEAILALGLLMDPNPSRNQVSSTDGLSFPVGTPVVSEDERSSRHEATDSRSSVAQSGFHAPLYDISFIRNVRNVCIIGSRINFVTTILHHDDNVRAGLHTLHIKADPSAFHDSYERQKRVHSQMKAIRRWGSQLLVTSSTTPREFPLSVPRIKTRDLEEVVKDVFTWFYAASSPLSIMWLYDEGDDGNSRTSLIAQFLANFLGERRDLSASYFYTKQDTQSIIPTIALQLAQLIPELETDIGLTAGKNPSLFYLSLNEQMRRLLVGPLQAASAVCYKFPRLFLIHALEDCKDDVFQELFLQAFGEALSLLQQSQMPHKLILIGKHTAHLRECFSTAVLREIVRFRLLPISQDIVVN